MNSRRNYKDSLFVHMFGHNVNAKEYFLSLYNALHGTNLKIGEVTIKPVTLSSTAKQQTRKNSLFAFLPRPCGRFFC